MEEPVKGGAYKRWKCVETRFNDMLDKFYELHGCDRTTGLQTGKTLLELGMEDVAEKLERAGKL